MDARQRAWVTPKALRPREPQRGLSSAGRLAGHDRRKVTAFDMMGNASEAPYVNGRVALALTAAPVYVVSDNAAFMKTNVNPPAGYVAR